MVSRLSDCCTEIEGGGTAPTTFVQDFVADDGPARIVSEALKEFSSIDIQINNSGGSRPHVRIRTIAMYVGDRIHSL
ncbi:hypothetical protein FNL56_09375 [Tardiphaga sp. vice304]|uniref:hypothetical protein n=1 Tax=unclassified Tardiphaga TaxID=2631404 RepID=UPI0011652B9B|nr:MULTISPECIES: hypothetical protein [unclassified Tardiphaga]QDM16067.1 hypothetical protein FNL53_09220 [Tardiphaga sp. vice278]QDM26275.1 hypothetical protein FNL56_09375 [Tardiphaga sp. vice304]